MDCAIPTYTLIIKLINNKQIGIAHCGHLEREIVDPLYFEEVDQMTSDEFWKYLQAAYKKIPAGHRYTPDYSCNTKNTVCLYNDKTLEKVVVSTYRRCNIKCPMCMVSSNSFLPADVDKKLYFNILNKLKGHGINEIGLTHNGEPFVAKKETFEYLDSLIPKIDCNKICITTNAILLNEDDILKLKKLKDRGIDIFLMTSCSAITEDTYKKVHNNDNFNKVIDNIILLSKYNLLSSISFVIQKNNLHELDYLKNFWRDKGVNAKLYTRIMYGFDGKDIVNMKEYKNFMIEYEKLKNIDYI